MASSAAHCLSEEALDSLREGPIASLLKQIVDVPLNR
jgi:hypothetical protein